MGEKPNEKTQMVFSATFAWYCLSALSESQSRARPYDGSGEPAHGGGAQKQEAD